MAANKKEYRVFQNEGRFTWSVEEMWDGGVKRGPFGTREAAIANEEKIARNEGFIDGLSLQEVGEEITVPANAFEKDEAGNWQCVRACSINMNNTEMGLSAGMKFTKGEQYLGMDIAEWLDEHLGK